MFRFEQKNMPLIIVGISFFLSYLFAKHIDPYRAFYNDALVIIGVWLAMFYLTVFQDATIRIPRVILAPFALIIVIAVQTAMGMVIFPADSIFPVLYFLSCIVAMILGASLARQENGFNQLCFTLAIAFVATGVLSIICQLIQLANLQTYGLVMPLNFNTLIRPYGNIGQPNLLALVMCFALASVWYLYGIGRIKVGWAVALALLMLTSLALTQSRIVWIILPVYFMICWQRQSSVSGVQRTLLILLLLYFVLVSIGLPGLLHYAGLPFDTLGNRVSQNSVRKVMWEQAWLIGNVHPWFGAGWFQFGEQQAIYSLLFELTEYSEYAHNIILNMVAEIGFPLTLILTAAALYWFYICCIRCWNFFQVRFLSLILVAVAIHSMVEYPLWNGYILIPVGLIAGALHVETLGWNEYGRMRRLAVLMILPCVMVSAFVVFDFQRVANRFVSISDQQASGKTTVEGIDKPEFTFFPQYYDYFQCINIKPYPGMPGKDIALLEHVSLRFAFAPILERLSLAFAYNKRSTEALRVLIVIQKLHGERYIETYNQWSKFAQIEPGYFGEIFKRLPQPRPVPDKPQVKVDQVD